MSWIDWYFSRAMRTPSPRLRDFIFKEVRPGCSVKQLEVIGKAVLDKDDPREVDWTRVRSAHLYLKRDKLSERAILSAMGNLRRMASAGLIRRVNEWFRKTSGFSIKQHAGIPTELVDEDAFDDLLASVCDGQPDDMATALRAALMLSYYCGIKSGKVCALKHEDFIYLDERLLLYNSGRLLELPPLVCEAVAAQMAKRDKRKRLASRLFRPDQGKAIRLHKTLHHTHATLRTMRG